MQLNPPKSVYEQTYRIYLEDTDAGGIVYHANHLKLFERCRRDWLRQLGMTSYFYQSHSNDKPMTDFSTTQFVVSQANIRYFQPILLDSLVTVSVSTVKLKSASLLLEQQIFLAEDATVRLCHADITLACVTTCVEDGQTNVRPTRLPPPFVTLLKNL